MNIEQIKQALAFYRTAEIPGTGKVGIPAIIWGKPGIGKSEGVAQFVRTIDTFFDGATWRPVEAGSAVLVDERLSTTESVDWRGMARDREDGVEWSRPDAFVRLWAAHNAGRPSVLFLDECNVGVTPSLFAVLLQLTLDGKVGCHEIPPSTYVCAAGNRPGESQGAQPLPEANANRLAHLDAEFDLDTWAAWALDNGVDPRVIAFGKFREALLLSEAQAPQPVAGAPVAARRQAKTAFLTARSLSRLAPLLSAPAALLHGLCAGVIGQAEAAEFVAFLATWKQFATYAQICADPANVGIPDEAQASILFALAVMLAKRLDRATIAQAMTYIKRLPRDWQTFIVVSATQRQADLRETKPVILWLLDNQDVTLS